MQKRNNPTILEGAIIAVPEFENVLRKLDQQVALRGQSKMQVWFKPLSPLSLPKINQIRH